MINNILEFIKNKDEEVGYYILRELDRQQKNIELIASENIVSEATMLAMGTPLTNKYAEGYPNRRYYGGCQEVDKIEQIAIDRACKLFGAEHANVQPHCGSNANFAVYYAFLKPGDTILSMSLANGGHLTHGSPASMSGKLYNIVSYGIDENGFIDYEDIKEKIIKYRPKLVLAGASAYPREIDFEKIRNIIDECVNELNDYERPIYMVDMAHIAGLVAAGLHKSPIPYADVVTTTTHKTLRGPRGGLILCKNEFAKKIDSAVFPGSQGGPLEHIIAAKAICFGEALKPEFIEYQEQIIKNAKALSDALINDGFKLITNGTDNHLMLIDLRNMGITGKEFEHRLDEVRITVNKNSIPNDPEKPTITSGIRIGTPAVTSRGFTEKDMVVISHLMRRVATDWPNGKEDILNQVEQLTKSHPIY